MRDIPETDEQMYKAIDRKRKPKVKRSSTDIITVKVRKPDSEDFIIRQYAPTEDNWHVACADARDYGTKAEWLSCNFHTGLVDIMRSSEEE